MAEGDETRAVCDQIGDSADLALDVVNHGRLERLDSAGLLEVKGWAKNGGRLFLGCDDLVSLAPLEAVDDGVEAVAHGHFERHFVGIHVQEVGDAFHAGGPARQLHVRV